MSPSTREPKYALPRSIAMPSGWKPSGRSKCFGYAVRAEWVVPVGAAAAVPAVVSSSAETETAATKARRDSGPDMS
jgi:hypothetical protein